MPQEERRTATPPAPRLTDPRPRADHAAGRLRPGPVDECWVSGQEPPVPRVPAGGLRLLRAPRFAGTAVAPALLWAGGGRVTAVTDYLRADLSTAASRRSTSACR